MSGNTDLGPNTEPYVSIFDENRYEKSVCI